MQWFDLGLESDVFERIAESPAVTALDGQPRFGLFQHADTETSDWIAWLDIDFDNRQHLIKTAILAAGICDIEQADPETRRDTVLTALVHDAAESVVGDRNIHLKKDDDDAEEIAILGQLISDGRLNLTEHELKTVVTTMEDKHTDCATLAGKLFDLSEVVGYVYSGATAWQTVHSEGLVIPKCQQQYLEFLGIQVVSHWSGYLRSRHDEGMQTPAVMHRALGPYIEDALSYSKSPQVMSAYYDFMIDRGISSEKAQVLVCYIPGAQSNWDHIGRVAQAA